MRLKIHNKGLRELRTSPWAMAQIRPRARRIASAAGPGVEVLPEQAPRNRAHLAVGPVTGEAARRVASTNALIRAIEAGR